MLRKNIVVAAALIFLSLQIFTEINAQNPASYPEKLWVKVIYYDYHTSGLADFERCGGDGTMGMVTSALDAQRKPVPVPSVACPADPSATPCACHLGEWYRVSGQNGSDQTPKFVCDSVTDPLIQKWSWTGLTAYQGRTGEFVGPNYDPGYSMANVVIYDSLPFRFVPNMESLWICADKAKESAPSAFTNTDITPCL